jgi:hypothetical protein
MLAVRIRSYREKHRLLQTDDIEQYYVIKRQKETEGNGQEDKFWSRTKFGTYLLTGYIGVTLGGGGGQCLYQYFFNLGIFLITELNNGK